MNPISKSVRRTIIRTIGAVILTANSVQAFAQEPSYPTKPVKIVVPYSAGGPVDALARALGQKLSGMWGQPVIIDNKPGANEIIAATSVAKSPSDGYTLMLATDPTMSLNPFLYQKLSYNPSKELTPITRIAVSNMAFVVPASLQANTLKDFVAYVRANPGKLSYGSSGVGNGTHLSMAQFVKNNQIDMVHVPYKGLSPALQDMFGNAIQATLGAVSVVKPFVDSGKVKVLGVSGAKRASALPNVPTFTEAGFPGFEASFYYGLIAPSGLDAAIKAKIHADIKRVVSEAQFRKDYLDNFALDAVLDTPEEFSRFLVADREAAKAKIKVSGASLD